MKPIAILALAIALEAGFLLSVALPPPALARAEAAVKSSVVAMARAVLPGRSPAKS
jgi:hypothetical protein